MTKKIIIWTILNIFLFILTIFSYEFIHFLYRMGFFGTYLKSGTYVIEKSTYLFDKDDNNKNQEFKFKKFIFNITEANKNAYENSIRNNFLKHESMFKKISYYEFSAYFIDEEDKKIEVSIIKTFNLEGKRNAPISLDVIIKGKKYANLLHLYKIRTPFGEPAIKINRKIRK